MPTNRFTVKLYILTLRILLIWQKTTNRLRGLILHDRRAPVYYYEIGDRRTTAPIRARHLVAPVFTLQGLVLLYALISGPQSVYMAGIGTIFIVGLVILPTTRRKA